jgi:hypothetical protein
MNGMTTLTTALLDLSHELAGADLKLIIGGGFGIYLKYRELLKTTRTTLLSKWPEPRSTNDLDLFLRAELLTDSRRLVPLVQALKILGYKPVETAKYYQFFKPGPGGGEAGSLKVDILTGPEPTLRRMGIKAKDRRAYPKPKLDLHAHTLDEALTLEEHLQVAIIGGRRGNGEAGHAEVFLPHSFTFIMMKAFALRDRIDDSEKDYGRHHALDLYTTVAMMTEEDWDISLELRRRHRADGKIIEAAELVRQLFGDESSRGVLRLKESKYYRTDFQVKEFIAALRDLFALGRM